MQIRKRLTYANVMSSLAVFLILGGATAVAAKKIGSNEIKGNSITTGKVKKEAITRAKLKKASVDSSKLADGAVTTAKIANDAVTGEKANESTFGQVPNAANAAKLNGLSATDYLASFALVNPGGTVLQSSGVEAAVNFGGGLFAVRFSRPVTAKAYSATIVGEDIGQAQINSQPCIAPTGINDSNCPAAFENANSLFVNTEDSTGTNANRAFMVVLLPTG
jgi:hypothetical protein